MYVYIIELFLVLMLGIMLQAKKIKKKMFVVLSFTIMALVLGLRGAEVGEDTQHFIDIFHYARGISWGKALTSGFDTVYNTVWGVDLSVETGYLLLNKVIGIFTDNGQWLIFTVAALTCWLFAKFILDNCESVFLPTYIFMCESLYMSAFNLMRQILALAIAIQAYKYIKENKIRKAILIILIAFLIHKTAIIFLILIPFGRINKKQRALKWIFVGSVVLMASMPILNWIVSRLVPRYAAYFTTNFWDSTLGLGSMLLMMAEVVICLYAYYRHLSDNDTEAFTAISCTAIGLACDVMGMQVVIFSRIALMFKVFLFFLFPFASRYFAKGSRKYYRILVMIVLAISFFSYASSDARVYSFFWQ